jgi:hypothetical protein
MEELSRNPEADVCYATLVSFEQVGDTVLFNQPWIVPPANNIRESLYANTTFLPSTVLVRRSRFLAVGGSDPSVNIGEDWDLWLRLLHSGAKFAACQEPLVKYRIHSNNMSRSALESLDAAKAIYRRLVLPQLPPHTRWLAYTRMQSAHESSAAQALRNNGDSSCRSMMATSILRWPWNDPHRYKMLAHMILKGPRKDAR